MYMCMLRMMYRIEPYIAGKFFYHHAWEFLDEIFH